MLNSYCDAAFYSGRAYVNCADLNCADLNCADLNCADLNCISYGSVCLMACRDKLYIEMGLCCFVKIFLFKPFLCGFNRR